MNKIIKYKKQQNFYNYKININLKIISNKINQLKTDIEEYHKFFLYYLTKLKPNENHIIKVKIYKK